MSNPFDEYGKPHKEVSTGGIKYSKRKTKGERVDSISYDKRVKNKPEKSGGIGYGTRSKYEPSGGIGYGKKIEQPKSSEGISYKKSKPVKGESVGGIGYGERAKPTYEKEEFGLESVSGVTIEKTKYGKKEKKEKPLFGSESQLTSNKSADQLVKEEKSRLKRILKEAKIAEKKAKGEKIKRAKVWKKKPTYSFNRGGPLARKLRKIF